MPAGGSFHVRRHDANVTEVGCDLSQRSDTRAIDAVVIRHEDAHTGGRANEPPRTVPFLNLRAVVNVWILANEDAGRGLSDTTLRELVESAGYTVTEVVTTFDAHTRPSHEGIDLIVAAGGDGTVATVATISASTSIPMAVLPLGTANNIASSFRIGRDIRQLVAHWGQARPIAFDLGRARCGANTWAVVEGIGVGLIPTGMAAAERVLESSNDDAHPAAQVATAIEVFYDVLKTLEPVQLTITIDRVQLSDAFLLVEVLNIPSVGPNLVLAPGADASDRLFDVVLAELQHRSELVSYFESRLRKREHRLSLRRYRASHVRIESCEELHVDDERINTCGLGEIEVTMQDVSATVLV